MAKISEEEIREVQEMIRDKIADIIYDGKSYRGSSKDSYALADEILTFLSDIGYVANAEDDNGIA